MASFTILTVCTGNVCRSPIAEKLLRLELRDLPGVRVHSAGTNALVNAPMTPEVKANRRRAWALPTPRRTSPGNCATSDIREADLVLD